jgi:hypothetical protein
MQSEEDKAEKKRAKESKEVEMYEATSDLRLQWPHVGSDLRLQ